MVAPETQKFSLESRPCIPALGVEVTSHSAKEIAKLAILARGAASGGEAAEGAQAEAEAQRARGFMKEVAALVQKHSLLVLRSRQEQELLTPEQIGAIYKAVHEASGLRVLENPRGLMTASRNVDPTKSISRLSFPGFPETQILGHSQEPVKDWFGLSGMLKAGDTWWERGDSKESPFWGTWHHDGGHGGANLPNPAFVAMYCQENPRKGGSTVHFSPDAKPLTYPAGATLFCSTRLALELASPHLRTRARSMVSVYSRGFGRAVEGVYPVMRQSRISPVFPSAEKLGPDGQPFPGSSEAGAFLLEEEDRPIPASIGRSVDAYLKQREDLERDDPTALAALKRLYSLNPKTGEKEMREALVQTDPFSGKEYVLMSTQSLHHLEEPGKGALSWSESMDFLEELLGPAAQPPHVVALDWRPGDYAFWDNRCTWHIVTGTHANQETGDPGYAALEGERRLMTRTEMQSTWVPDRYPPGLSMNQKKTAPAAFTPPEAAASKL